MTRIVQVMGPNRSGSTMMHLMLAHSDSAFACGELYALHRPWRRNHLHDLCNCDVQNSSCIWYRIRSQDETKVFTIIAESTGAEWLIDESKSLSWIFDSQGWAARANMDIYNVLMFKDPLALMYSNWRRKNDFRQFVDDWRRYHKRFLNLNVPFVSVNLEQLCEEPAEKLRNLCELIGMEYFPGKEEFWNTKHCHLFGSGDVRRQMTSGMSRFRRPAPYPDDFMQYVEPIIEKFCNDKEISKILGKISACEVDQRPDLKQLDQKLPRQWRRPLWWWVDKCRRTYRTRFPHEARFSE